ncbi:MAG: carbohydrate ABC transporter permease [Bacteroidetes bacterium]|nr:carbohydrate ABC transporter permease [Bacteroidota bacterium]
MVEKTSPWIKTALYVLLGIIALGMIAPMAWMLLLSLRQHPESYDSIGGLITAPTTIGNYTDALNSDAFGKYFLNSTIVALLVTTGNVVFCLWVGYALARRKFYGKRWVFGSVLGVMMIPQQVIMIPLYRLMVEFGWINTYFALVVPWLVTPLGVFLVRQYILALPAEIEDAARIDGAGEWYILWKIVMPLSRPILTVLAMYVFLSNWNSFLFPFLFTNEESMRTLPVGLAFYLGKQSIDWGHLMAGASISALPILLMFVFFHKRIIQGLTAGALKE